MSLFKNDGNNPLVALGMVFALGVVPLALMGGIIGGAAWLGWIGVKAAIAVATTGTVAGVLSPAATVGAVLGGAALLAAGHYTGALQGIGYMFKKHILRKDPDAPSKKSIRQAEAPSPAWTKMVQDLNARNGFGDAAKKEDKKPEASAPSAAEKKQSKPPEPQKP